MRTSKKLRRLVVDANPILSALLRGKAHAVFTDPALELFTTEHTVREVIEYIPQLAQKPRLKAAGIVEADLYFALVVAPLEIYGRDFYGEKLEEARRRIGERDPEDVDLLALAIKLSAPVWSNDSDYKAAGVVWYTTARLLKRLGRRR